ncbi:hypothetical protein C1632_02610 [Microbacterium testaceum]|uniref:hypothetical protein n=1 Tax=Microbacterium testaceum TaxID=2033 RepID=UPI000CCF7640|nr:hypothetical protein [Microbacterium testaceum]PNW10670.1 hypothetical protein C1632_02610 [Microbacterium testaceum]
MPDITDGVTGELRNSPAEQAVSQMLDIPSGIYGPTLGSGDIDKRIEEIADLIEHIAKVILVLYEDKHAAEEKYLGAFAQQMTAHAEHGAYLARQFAHTKTGDELRELNIAKEKLRYAEEMAKAVQNRSFGLMNIGKRYTAAMGFGGGR